MTWVLTVVFCATVLKTYFKPWSSVNACAPENACFESSMCAGIEPCAFSPSMSEMSECASETIAQTSGEMLLQSGMGQGAASAHDRWTLCANSQESLLPNPASERNFSLNSRLTDALSSVFLGHPCCHTLIFRSPIIVWTSKARQLPTFYRPGSSTPEVNPFVWLSRKNSRPPRGHHCLCFQLDIKATSTSWDSFPYFVFLICLSLPAVTVVLLLFIWYFILWIFVHSRCEPHSHGGSDELFFSSSSDLSHSFWQKPLHLLTFPHTSQFISSFLDHTIEYVLYLFRQLQLALLFIKNRIHSLVELFLIFSKTNKRTIISWYKQRLIINLCLH